MKRIKAIYPGSFDPPTNGHLDLIERGSKIFDELVVAILRNPEKDPLFSVADRRKMLEAMTSGFDNVSVDTFDGLTVTTRCASRPRLSCAAFAPSATTNTNCKWP
jgi:pantetheine-phosphate adenylyltransferase